MLEEIFMVWSLSVILLVSWLGWLVLAGLILAGFWSQMLGMGSLEGFECDF